MEVEHHTLYTGLAVLHIAGLPEGIAVAGNIFQATGAGIGLEMEGGIGPAVVVGAPSLIVLEEDNLFP